MTEEEKLKRAYEIYKEGHYCKKIIPLRLKDEFESYNISDEQLAIWNNENAINCYNEALNEMNSIGFNNSEIQWYISIINIYLRNVFITKDNFEQMVNLFEMTYKNGLFVKFFEEYERSSGGFSELLILTDYWRSKVKDSRYYYGDEFAGVIPYLYHIKEYDLYNRLMHIVIEALKVNGCEFQGMFKDLMDFTKKYEDIKNHLLLKEALDYCKKNCKPTPYFEGWKI